MATSSFTYLIYISNSTQPNITLVLILLAFFSLFFFISVNGTTNQEKKHTHKTNKQKNPNFFLNYCQVFLILLAKVSFDHLLFSISTANTLIQVITIIICIKDTVIIT